MKNIYQLVVAVAVLFVPILVSVPAAAAPVCDIGFTGPDSNNMCVSKETYNCSVVNKNSVTITNSTNQTVASGAVEVGNNTSGGSATSGSVSNDAGTTFTVTIKNGDNSEEKPASCLASVVIPAKENPETPKTPETPASAPTTPGRGAAAAPVQPAQAATPTALPVTSGGSAPTLALTGSTVITAVAMYAYRRFLS